MGGMYAAHFARAGFEVELVARGERAERLRAGLTVNAEPLVASVIDIDQVQDAEPADLLIFAVKDRHLADATGLLGQPDGLAHEGRVLLWTEESHVKLKTLPESSVRDFKAAS